MSNVRIAAMVAAFCFLAALTVNAEDGLYRTIGEIRAVGQGGDVDSEGVHRAVATKDGFVYVLCDGGELLVFDGRSLDGKTDPAPVIEPIEAVSVRPRGRIGLLIVEDRLYCYGWEGGEVFDIDDPATPTLVGAFGDPSTHVSDLLVHEGHLVAACHERILVYALDTTIDYPTLVAEMRLEAGKYAYALCVVGDRLCATGFRRRQSGEIAYWLGVWDFAMPERPSLVRIVATEDRGYRVVSVEGYLLAVSERRAELWKVDGEKPDLIEAIPVSGNSVALDGEVVVLDRVALTVREERVEVLGAVDCGADLCHASLPRLGAAEEPLVVLPRTASVAVLQRCEEVEDSS